MKIEQSEILGMPVIGNGKEEELTKKFSAEAKRRKTNCFAVASLFRRRLDRLDVRAPIAN